MADLQWADWSADGRLLGATTDGRLQIRTGRELSNVTDEVDLAPMPPEPRRPPVAARTW